MLISINTPVLNGGRTIERVLRSLSEQRANFEHIVMDAGSTDDTEAIVRRYENRYSLKWHRQPDHGVFEGMWNGFSRTQGDIMGTIFADDMYLPWTLSTVHRIFEENPDVHWITGLPSWYFEETSVAVTSWLAPVWPQWAIRRGLASQRLFGFLQQESIFWRRSLWEKADPKEILLKYRWGADFHMWRRFAQFAPLRTVNSVLACFTVSANQISGKFRERYLADCGIPDSSYTPSFMRRMIARVVSILLSGKVVRVTRFSR